MLFFPVLPPRLYLLEARHPVSHHPFLNSSTVKLLNYLLPSTTQQRLCLMHHLALLRLFSQTSVQLLLTRSILPYLDLPIPHLPVISFRLSCSNLVLALFYHPLPPLLTFLSLRVHSRLSTNMQ